MRPLLPLALLSLVCAPVARAQTRIGAVETGAGTPSGQNGSLSSSLTGGGAPQLVTLNLAAPSLAASPGLATPALTPTPLTAAAPYAAAATPLALTPAALPESAIVPVAPAMTRLAVIKPSETRFADAKAGPSGDSAGGGGATLSELIDATKRLFGESSRPGYQSADYLRPGAPFHFGSAETFRYRTALNAYGAKTSPSEIAVLVDAASALAKSAGIAVEPVERAGLDGSVSPALRVIPDKNGHRLNRLAWDLKRSFDTDVEYAPHRTSGGVAAFNSTDKALFLPDFGRDDAFEAILHESRHAAFAKRLRRGDLSAFHAALLAYRGRSIAPNAMSYDGYMSLEELSTHAKTILHAVVRAQGAGEPGARAAAVADAKKYAFQFMDVLRSAEINLFQLQRKLAKGEIETYRVSGPSWPEIPGGHWEAVNLPHAIFVLPVRDEAPAPKRALWDRLFKAAPETAAVKAARRHADALRPMIKDAGDELDVLLGALKGEEPDLKAARASASRMTALAARADERFAAAP